MADDIVIKIAGDSKAYNEELEKVGKSTEDLEGQLKRISAISGVAFAGLVGGMSLAVKEFAEAEAVGARVNAIIKATGGAAGVTADQVLAMASSLQDVTTFGDEAIASGAGILLTFKRIGADVLPEATEAMLDLATRMGTDAEGAAQVLGKALNNPVEGLTALKKAGIDFTDAQQKVIQEMVATGDVAGAQRLVLEQLRGTIGGLAKSEVATTEGAFRQLKNTFGEVVENVGKELAPAFKAAAQALNSVLGFVKEHPEVTKLAASFAVAGTVVTGLTTALGAGALAFLKIKAAMAAAKVATDLMALSTKALVGATGIGLLVIIGTEIALNWETIWPRMAKIFQAFASTVGGLASNIGGVLSAAFSFDFAKLQSEFGKLKATLAKGYEEAFAAIPKREGDAVGAGDGGKALEEERARLTEEVALKKQKADEKDAIDALAKAKEQERQRQHAEIIRLEAEGASQEIIRLTKEEGELKLALMEQHNADEQEGIQKRFEQVQLLLADQRAIEAEQRQLLRDEILAQNEEFNALTQEQQALYMQRNQVALQTSIDTELTARRKFLDTKLREQINSNNLFLQEQIKYNTAYATVNQYLRDSEVGKSLNFFQTMQKMQQSHIGILRTIGKAAALAQIAMDTARGATQALTAFPIPFVGPALGMAAAAAIVAFGVEQAARVTGIVGAADGGVLTGGIAGMDSIPMLGMPGELVAPTRNFDEVVNSVARERAARGELPGVSATGGGGQGPVEVVSRVEIDLTRNAARMITVQQVADRGLGLSREAS